MIWAKKVESIASDIPKVIKLLIEAFKLKEVVRQRRVDSAQTMDGEKLSKNRNHTSMGIRLTDIETKDPVTGEYLFKDEGLDLIQSRDLCIPCWNTNSSTTSNTLDFLLTAGYLFEFHLSITLAVI